MGVGKIKFLSFIVFLMLLIFPPEAIAAPTLKEYNNISKTGQKAQIIWQLSGLGKPSGQMIMTLDGKLITTSSNKMICFDEHGELLWETKIKGSKMGNPILVENGSIITAGKGMVVETKPNGARGWSFTALPSSKDKEPQIAGGVNEIIYLPLPYGLYALDFKGRVLWIFSPWHSSDHFTVKSKDKRIFIECAADEHFFYAIYGDEKGSYKLIAIDNKGNYHWDYWLGDILDVHILPGGSEKVYVTATLKPGQGTRGSKSSSSKLNHGQILCFDCRNGQKPLWQGSVKTAGNLTEPVIAGNLLYVNGGSKLYALDLASGNIRLEQRFLHLVSPPAVDAVNNRIYAGSNKGVLYAINSDGRLDWSLQLEGAIEQSPRLGYDGYIYIYTQKGNLYKIKDLANS